MDLAHGRRLAVGTERGTEAPGANRFDGLFIEAESQSLGNADVGGAAVGGDDGDQQHGALILGFYGFIGKLRLRAIQAGRAAIAAGSRVGVTAAGVVAIAGAEAVALPVADSVAASLPQRIAAKNLGERIAPILRGDVRDLDIGIADERRRYRPAWDRRAAWPAASRIASN